MHNEGDFMDGYTMAYSNNFSVLDPRFKWIKKRSLNPFTGFRKTIHHCVEGELTFAENHKGKIVFERDKHCSIIDGCSLRSLSNDAKNGFVFLTSGNPVSSEDGKMLSVFMNHIWYWYDLMGLYHK
jgi:hypothetical protein